ncbi:MAG: FAD:protein FMN transferase [Bacteroidota bacterium]
MLLACIQDSKWIGRALCFLLLWGFGMKAFGQRASFTHNSLQMGSAFIFKAIHPDQELCKQATFAAEQEVRRVEELISSWKTTSQTSDINQHAGIKAVKVDLELFSLIKRAIKISQLTDGAFDLTFASADRIWRFDGSMTHLPDSQTVRASVANIDFQAIQLNDSDTSVFLPLKGMKIGFGGIGKGYAANRAKSVMQAMGIKNGLVNAGGDLICWGKEEQGGDWHIGIADPLNKKAMLAWLVINDLAVVTSGDYERYTLIEDQKYAHIINPHTGYPVQGVSSVSIFCPDTELADGLATAIFVLGPIKGIGLLDQLIGIEGLVVDQEGKLFSSKGLNLHYYQESSPANKPIKKIGRSHEK